MGVPVVQSVYVGYLLDYPPYSETEGALKLLFPLAYF